MKYKIIVTPSASTDILAADRYISVTLGNEAAADRLLDEFQKRMEQLSHTPYINPLVGDNILAANGVRFQIVKNYMAFYTVNEDNKTVFVIAFLHSQQDWINYLRKNGYK